MNEYDNTDLPYIDTQDNEGETSDAVPLFPIPEAARQTVLTAFNRRHGNAWDTTKALDLCLNCAIVVTAAELLRTDYRNLAISLQAAQNRLQIPYGTRVDQEEMVSRVAADSALRAHASTRYRELLGVYQKPPADPARSTPQDRINPPDVRMKPLAWVVLLILGFAVGLTLGKYGPLLLFQ